MLAQKAGIVTGAAQGFGLATVERLAAQGAQVVMVDIKGAALRDEAARLIRIGHAVIAVEADVSDAESTLRMLDAAEAAFGRIDFLHQNAATQVERLLHETTPEDWDRLMAVNVRSMFLGARAVIPRMMVAGGGVIVNSASVLAMTADELLPAYTASKHAVLGLTRAIAVTKAYARAGIRCNAICPGDIRTAMVQRYWDADPDPVAAQARTSAHYPAGRIAEPQDMADVVCWLVSDMARAVNGAAIVADGGVTAQVY